MAVANFSSPLTQSGVQQTRYRSDALELVERPGRRLLRVRSLDNPPPPGSVFAEWPQRTGQCLPGPVTVLCLRPREWLCCGEPGSDIDSIHTRLDASTSVVYDQSDGLAAFRIQGAAAPWLLSKFSGLDFAGGMREDSHCARTRMGDVGVIVHFLGRDEAAFDLLVDRSQARHLWERLLEAAPHAEALARQMRGAA